MLGGRVVRLWRSPWSCFGVLAQLARREGLAWVIVALATLAQAALIASVSSCRAVGPAAPAMRASVRRVVDSLGTATVKAVRACEDRSIVLAKSGDGAGSDRLWRDCRAAYEKARPALIAAASGVDAWSDATRGETVCAALHGGRALLLIADAIELSGGSLPPVLEDARASVSDLLPYAEGFACGKT